MSRSEKQDKKISSIIGPKVEIRGAVSASGGILVYGSVFGDIRTDGLVRLSHGSYVKGIIHAKDACVGGILDGDLVVERKVELGSKSILTGNLIAKILVIEEGAKFEGICRMTKETNFIAKADHQSDEDPGDQ